MDQILRVMLGFVALVWLVACSPPADGAFWERVNPGGGGAFHAVAAAPGGLVLVGSDLSGAYLSRDGGLSWRPIGSEQGLATTHVSGVGFDARDPDVFYLGTEDGLYRSTDGGATFAPVLAGGYVTDVRFAPSDPDVGYLIHHPAYDVAEGTVYRSDDRGRSWRPLPAAGLPAGLHLLELAVDPRDPERVFVLAGEGRFACGEAALFASADGGASWTRVGADLGQVADFALDPDDPDVLYLTTYGDVWDPGYACVTDDPNGGYLYRGSADAAGWNFVRVSDALGSRNLLVLPGGGRVRVFDLDTREFFATPNGEVSWARLGGPDDWDPGWSGRGFAHGTGPGGDAKTLFQDPADPDRIYWVDWQFVWGSRDGGATVRPLHTEPAGSGWRSCGVDNTVPFELAFDADGRHVYFGLADLGCFASDDRGASFRPCNDPAYTGSWQGHGGNSLALAADPDRAGVVWVSQAQELDTRHTLLVSRDFGRTWAPADAGLPGSILSGLSVDPESTADRRTLFVTAGGDVYRSRDDGASWTRVLACGGCRYTAVRGARVLAGGEVGLWLSTRGGEAGSWERVGPPEFAGDGADVFTDSGWSGVAAIRFDPSVPNRVYVAVFGPGRGIYRSDDGGVGWTRVRPGDFFWDVAIDPRDADVLYAASSSAFYSGGYDPASQGVLRSTDGGRTWQAFNEGLAWPFACRLVFDRSGAELWVASPGLGYAHRELR
ncbi:WD40/YVTN/BNR-like repeat-containing protein [Oceanithermus sp.]